MYHINRIHTFVDACWLYKSLRKNATYHLLYFFDESL